MKNSLENNAHTKPPEPVPDGETSGDNVMGEILRAVRDTRFGLVEVVLHHGKVTEIRKTTRLRFSE